MSSVNAVLDTNGVNGFLEAVLCFAAAGLKGSGGSDGKKGQGGRPGLKGDKGEQGFPGQKGRKSDVLLAEPQNKHWKYFRLCKLKGV